MSGRIGLTRRQHDALVYLTGHPDASYREIGTALGFAESNLTAGVFRLLNGLEERGYIRRRRLHRFGAYVCNRSIEVLKPAPIHINGEPYRFIPMGRA